MVAEVLSLANGSPCICVRMLIAMLGDPPQSLLWLIHHFSERLFCLLAGQPHPATLHCCSALALVLEELTNHVNGKIESKGTS